MERTQKSVLVTGATGFIGKSLIAKLLSEGLQVYALSRREKLSAYFDERVRIIRADITSEICLPSEVSIIYHCAGAVYRRDQMEKVNVQGTKRVVDVALKRNCRLIHLSSAGVVGKCKENHIDESVECHPQNLYEQTKFKAEEIVKKGIDRGLKAQILRPTIVFGIGRDPAKDSFLHLIKAIQSGRYKHIGDGRGIYNIIHVNEVVRAMRVLDNDTIPNGGVYFINSPISFREMSKIVQSVMITNPEVYSVPYFLAFGAVAFFSVFSLITSKKMPLTFSRLSALTNKKVFSQERLLKMTSYRPLLNVEDYIKQVYEGYAKNGLLS